MIALMKETIKSKLRETKKELVLDALDELFEQSGFGNPRMQEIAESIGISVGALYKLFPSKDALLYEYITHEIHRFRETLLQRSAPLHSPEERLILFIALKFETFARKRRAFEDPILGDPLFFFKMNIRRESPIRPIAEYLAEQFALLSEEKPFACRDCLQAAYLLNGYVTGYIEHWYNEGIEPDESPEAIFHRFLQGMMP